MVTGPAPAGSGYDFFTRLFCPKFGMDEVMSFLSPKLCIEFVKLLYYQGSEHLCRKEYVLAKYKKIGAGVPLPTPNCAHVSHMLHLSFWIA